MSNASKSSTLLKGLVQSGISLPFVEEFSALNYLVPNNNFCFSENSNIDFLCRKEKHIPGCVLTVYELKKPANSAQLLTELSLSQISRAHLFALLERQINGNRGCLAVNGLSNIAHIGEEKLIYFIWSYSLKRWIIGVRNKDDGHLWISGSKVFVVEE